jgi:chromosome partitioning protein
MAPRTIAIAQQKGGVGKTTVTLNLAAAVANNGLRVLVLDMDPQANASQTLLPDYRERVTGEDFFTVNDLMEPGIEDGDIDGAIVSTEWGVDLVPSQQELANRDREGSTGIETRLRIALRGLQRPYDVVLVDCPPSLGTLTVNAFLASQEILMVAQPDIFSLQAVDQIEKTLATIEKSYDHTLKVLGLVLNNFEPTLEAEKRKRQFEERFGTLLAQVPKRTAISASAGSNRSVFNSDRPDTGLLIATFETLAADLGLRLPLQAVGS